MDSLRHEATASILDMTSLIRYYSRALATKWALRNSYDETAEYDPKTVTDLTYFNTGKLIMSGP